VLEMDSPPRTARARYLKVWLAKIVRLGPAFCPRLPIIALNLTHNNLGQPCAIYVPLLDKNRQNWC
jgi:hypothetical protein